ncbi:hypothetical protein [Methanoculleus chikugoensis]|uniref:hypothetical protein n=1 Tax=Methanoculleus chikugoensis TaxID=118126 RepID=UPI000AD16F88|nr:hypothetical protein [Methanoculleus chikugoensis]
MLMLRSSKPFGFLELLSFRQSFLEERRSSREGMMAQVIAKPASLETSLFA